MSNLICFYTRKHLDSDLCEIRAATPPKKKDEKTSKENQKKNREESNERVLRSYRLR